MINAFDLVDNKESLAVDLKNVPKLQRGQRRGAQKLGLEAAVVVDKLGKIAILRKMK